MLSVFISKFVKEILLVLDGTTGLNMLPQAREFNEVKLSFIIFHIKKSHAHSVQFIFEKIKCDKLLHTWDCLLHRM